MRINKTLEYSSLLIIFLFHSSIAQSAVLFETSFEESNWTHQQTKLDQTCLSSCGIPNGFNAYRDGMSYCTSVGNNNFYMNTGAGYPNETLACKNGNKCITFWTERCTDYFEDSDGMVGVWLDQEYDDIYVAYWIRFESDYNSGSAEGAQQKLAHIQYNTIGQNPWSYFSGTAYNFPIVVPGLYRYTTQQHFYLAPRCTVADDASSAHCNEGTPSYCPALGNCDFDADSARTVDAVLHDGQWHHIEFRIKMNTGVEHNFNADGIMQFWYDGVSRIQKTAIPYQQNAPSYGVRGINFVAIGGNNLIQPTSPSNSESWYAVDDLVISTTYIGPDYEIGGSDITAPTVSSASVNGSTVTVNFDETVVTTGYDSGDFNLDCTTGGNDISLSSPSGSGASRTFTAATAIVYGETCNLDYVGSTNDIEDSAGNDLVAFSNTSVTNNTPGIATVSGLSITGGSVQ